MPFKDEIKRLRLSRGLTQGALADLIKISTQAVQKWESGASAPKPDKLPELAKIFNVPVDYLARLLQTYKKNSPTGQKPDEGEENHKRRIEFNIIKIPVVSREMTACCGNGIPAMNITEDNTEEIVPCVKSLFRAWDDMRTPYGIHSEGDCLESDGIQNGMTAIINPAEEPLNGAMALVSISENLSIKHIFYLANGDILLRSDKGELRLTPQEQEDLQFYVLGSVVTWISGRPKIWTL